MATETDAGESAHDGDEQTETVEIDLAPADVERIELEIEQNGDGPHASESVEEWIESAVHIMFSHIGRYADRPVATPEVEVPPLVAERARLEYESARQRGKDTSLDEILMNEVEVRPEYRVDGYRIESGDDE